MIVRKNLKLSIIWAATWGHVVYFLVLALLVPALRDFAGWTWLHVPIPIIGTLGMALAILLGFRNTSAYDRWWEARKLWGGVVNASRTFARQVLTTVGPAQDATPEVTALRRSLVLGQVGFCHALRLHLRKQADLVRKEVGPWLPAEAADHVLSARNVPAAILLHQAERLARARAAGLLDTLHHVELERTLTELTNLQGGCERIKNTPFPRQYDFYPRIFVYVYTFFLPISFAESLGHLTAVVAVPTSFLFFALTRLGALTEDPFENRLTDTPMSAICRTIEQNLREALGDTDLPPPLEPVDGFLF